MDLYREWGLRPVINAYDKATYLGGARVLPEIQEVVCASLSQVFEIDQLQAVAGRVIAEGTGAESGCVTACAAAAITLGVAASMTGDDIARIGQLPDTTGMLSRVIIQKGHCINFGAPVTQMIRLAGAEVVEVGSGNGCQPWHIEHELTSGDVAAIVAVESYHSVGYRGVKTAQLAELAREAGVPLVVDAATQELRLREIVAMGPDLVGCSAHKYFGSTTAGIVAGREDLVDAVLLQNRGIGRTMKAGKEAIFGVIAGFDTQMQRNTDQWSRRERRKVERIIERLSDISGLEATISPDPNGCPFDRVRLRVDPETTGHTAASLRVALLEGEPAVHIRVYDPDEGCAYLNTTEMSDDELEVACDRIAALV